MIVQAPNLLVGDALSACTVFDPHGGDIILDDGHSTISLTEEQAQQLLAWLPIALGMEEAPDA